MAISSKPKKSLPSSLVSESESVSAPADPDGFLSELDSWGTRPNPASFEKLLESNYQKFAKALEQGYTAEDICRLAASHGLQVKPSTFRKYWQKLNAKSLPKTSFDTNSRQSIAEPLASPDSPASTTGNSAVNF